MVTENRGKRNTRRARVRERERERERQEKTISLATRIFSGKECKERPTYRSSTTVIINEHHQLIVTDREITQTTLLAKEILFPQIIVCLLHSRLTSVYFLGSQVKTWVEKTNRRWRKKTTHSISSPSVFFLPQKEKLLVCNTKNSMKCVAAALDGQVDDNDVKTGLSVAKYNYRRDTEKTIKREKSQET